MRLTSQAWQLRQKARQALEAGDVERAVELSVGAQSIQDTRAGNALRLLSAWLLSTGRRD